MELNIFDVEHGACALLTCDNQTLVMLDAGHNGTNGWRPGSHLKASGIARLDLLCVTNYDEDHVSGIENLFDNVFVAWLSRNKSVSAQTIRSLKSDTGMGPGIDRLIDAIENMFTGDGNATKQPEYAGLTRQIFHNNYPEFDDENNLSMVVHLNCNGRGILFPGDLERAGWLKLLERQDFQNALRQTHVLVASHHGRESGCCEEIFEYFNPYYVVISDKGYMYDTQQTVPFYRRFTKGGPFRGEQRHVLTTRNDGTINFTFNQQNWWPY